MNQQHTVAIVGAAGRMGRRLVALCHQADDLAVFAATESAEHDAIGEDAGELAGVGPLGVSITDALPEAGIDVVIDFSLPQGTRQTIAHCKTHNIALVVGTTGLTENDQQLIDDAAAHIPVMHATNYSLVVNVLNKLAADAAKLLGEDYDIEVLEAHHRFKRDAPSGTALTLARVLCDATGRDFDKDVLTTRSGDDVPREANQITVQSLRIGDHVGEHTAYFAALGERLEIKHVSTSRDSYAIGAVRAASWLVGKSAGRYDMKDVLGL